MDQEFGQGSAGMILQFHVVLVEVTWCSIVDGLVRGSKSAYVQLSPAESSWTPPTTTTPLTLHVVSGPFHMVGHSGEGFQEQIFQEAQTQATRIPMN